MKRVRSRVLHRIRNKKCEYLRYTPIELAHMANKLDAVPDIEDAVQATVNMILLTRSEKKEYSRKLVYMINKHYNDYKRRGLL